VNTYDPADRILYVHMTRELDPYSTPLESGRTCSRLPIGYANRSSRTSLRGEGVRLRGFARKPASLAAAGPCALLRRGNRLAALELTHQPPRNGRSGSANHIPSQLRARGRCLPWPRHDAIESLPSPPLVDGVLRHPRAVHTPDNLAS
jgi:hypothetical protein